MDPFTSPNKYRATRLNLHTAALCSPQDLPDAMNDREWWRERSGISVRMARQDDGDHDIYIYIYDYILNLPIKMAKISKILFFIYKNVEQFNDISVIRYHRRKLRNFTMLLPSENHQNLVS